MEQEKISFSKQSKDFIQAELKRYETKESSLIPVLYEAQKVFGYISPDVVELVSQETGIPVSRVNEVAQFYTMFNKEKIGENHIQVCVNISCCMVGARETMDYICKKAGVKPGEVSKDGKITVTGVECLGSCGTAPMAQINDKYYENLTPEKIDKILSDLR